MLEDLITRYRLEDKSLILLACCFGSIYVCVISSSAFLVNPWFFGVNLGVLLFVSIVWWAFYQTLFPFYLAQRLFHRNWEHKRLSKTGWSVALGFNFLAIFLISLSPATVYGTPMGYITMVLIASLFALLLRRTIKNKNIKTTKENFKNKNKEYSQSDVRLDTINENSQLKKIKEIKILDFLGIVSFILMGFSAGFLIFDPIQASSSRVNATALLIITIWTIFIMWIECSLLFIKKENIPI